MLTDLMAQTRHDFWLIVPQVQLALFGLFILVSDFLIEERYKTLNAWVAFVGVLFSGFSLWRLRHVPAGGVSGFNGSIVVDPFFIFFGFVFLAAAALVILLSVRYMAIEAEQHGEYYALMLFATIGMMFMASGHDLIVLFVALETMAISFYVLVGFLRNDRRSNEGALKYLLLGAFSSGILAYGFSLMYGMSGSTRLDVVAEALAARGASNVLVIISLVTVAAGLFFKIAAVPFHQWAPDVYEGAPTTITAYVSVASKTASFALLLRIFLTAFWSIRSDWVMLLAAVAVASMTLGNLAAITQNNLKRLLAYSSIAHVGYILLGLVAAVGKDGQLNRLGLEATAFYLLVYAFFNTGAFAVVIVLRRKGMIGDTIDDLDGLSERNPGAAVLMLIFLLSLGGIPPTAGFVAKLLIFWALIETNHYLLAILAVLYILPAVYYYFRIVAHMWVRESTDTIRPTVSPAQGLALAAMVLVTLAAGVYPDPFIRLAKYSLLIPLGR